MYAASYPLKMSYFVFAWFANQSLNVVSSAPDVPQALFVFEFHQV